MYEKLEPTGYNWKSVSKETQDFYFEEFKKYFAWRQSDAVIYQGWLANTRRKYSELCSLAHSAWEKGEQPDKRISMDVYLSWIEFWKTPKFQKKSKIQKNNRSSGVDGNLSTHTSGSASHRTIAAHAEKFGRLCEEQVKAGLPIDKNALFLEAAGGFDKKKRVYGLGSSQNLFYRLETDPCGSSFANVENHKLLEELNAVKDKMNTMENQITKLLEINSFHAQSPTTDVDVDDVDSQSGDE